MLDIERDAERRDESSASRYKELFRAFLGNNAFLLCEYRYGEDSLLIYDEELSVKKRIDNYMQYLQDGTSVCPEDRRKVEEFCLGKSGREIEIQVQGREPSSAGRYLRLLSFQGGGMEESCFVVIRDITQERNRESLLEERAKRDSLTMLYNRFFGRELVNEYLKEKDPYATCGLMMIDIDYFKYANDTFGHLFGDQVLVELARLLERMFDSQDVIMRVGGDEFVVFLKDISHAALVKKTMWLIRSVRELPFGGNGYMLTCSVGVCFLRENTPGYNYDQLYENADWALYRAKENGRNCYVFCDNLQRFELSESGGMPKGNIDIRYLLNDIISTAFEIFEKTSGFPVAMELLMQVIGYRFQLDRITVIRTDIQKKSTGRQYQWRSDFAPAVLETPGSFTKEDFLTLFRSYDEYQTTVLQCDNLEMYSPEGAALLMQGEAKTVLYAAMYCEGKYTGAISYVVCREKRHWSTQNRKELGEVTKIISAHLARSQASEPSGGRTADWTDYDSLTGLLTYSRFREEAERLIVGEYASSYLMLYSDFIGFKYFNQKCGYSVGDQLLKEFGDFVLEKMEGGEDACFSRIVSDQFLMLVPNRKGVPAAEWIDGLNKEFERSLCGRFQDASVRVRTGVYVVEPGCAGASYAIDAANYARAQVSGNSVMSVRVYDRELQKKQRLENEIINGIDEAMEEERFLVYLQPKISLEDGKIVGAEALVRWRTKEGILLEPDAFVPLCETSGRIEKLDYYVFERVVQFLARNRELGREQVPISVNASILHASDPQAVQKYLEILDRYQVDPAYLEIELTETATVEEYESVRRWFHELRAAGLHTAMDDFGAGYSVLNFVVDIPVDTVKLDRAFIKSCTSGDRGGLFLKRLVGMIKSLGYHVICEGVETEEQSEALRAAGCEEGQGFLFYEPLPMEEYEKMLYEK